MPGWMARAFEWLSLPSRSPRPGGCRRLAELYAPEGLIQRLRRGEFKPVLPMMFTVPPTALAGRSGVGTFVISIRSTLPDELAARSNVRSADGVETSAPSIMNTMPEAGRPRIEALPAV